MIFYAYGLVLTFSFNLTYPRSHFRSVSVTVTIAVICWMLAVCNKALSTCYLLAIFILILGGTIIPVLELRKQKSRGVTWVSQDLTGIRAELGLEFMQTRLLPAVALTCQLHPLPSPCPRFSSEAGTMAVDLFNHPNLLPEQVWSVAPLTLCVSLESFSGHLR